MSLNVAKLEKVRELDGGMVQARCPACAEGGHDRTGEHLRIYPDGKFGCCVHPKDGNHRKRIWALAGVRKPGTFSMRLKVLAHGHPSAMPAQSVKAGLTAFDRGTGGTRKGELTSPSPIGAAPAELETPKIGTDGASIVMLRACARVESTTANIDTDHFLERQRDFGGAVPAVPVVPTPGGEPPLQTASGERLPFLTAGGDLSIPFDSPERYHWWRGGQSVETTLAEVRAALASQKG